MLICRAMDEKLRLPDEIRSMLPLAVQAYITALETEIGTLRQQVAELQSRTRQTSRNSSRPPSSDPPSAPRRRGRPSSKRKRGAQPGHRRKERPLLAVEDVDEVVDHRPQQCPRCQKELGQGVSVVEEPTRQQVWDLPVVKPHVTEHRYHRVQCPCCQMVVQAERPVEVPTGAFGPGVVGLVGLLRGQYRLSVREVARLLEDVFQLSICRGSVIDLSHLLSQALIPAYDDSKAQLCQSALAWVDETGWKEAGKRRWLWVAVTKLGAVFRLSNQRNADSLGSLLGKDFSGIVTSDRLKTYRMLQAAQRQLCWAHLQRNWQAFSEHDDPVGAWGRKALDHIRRMFRLWHRFLAGELDCATLQTRMRPVQRGIEHLLDQGLDLPLGKAQSFCQELILLWPALWTFLTVEGVEPTNNTAERALRPAVLWRKGCFGSQSDSGKRFVERILTVVTTCRQQQRHVLAFLTETARAYMMGQPTPILFDTS